MTTGPFVKVLVLVGSTIVLGVLYELAFREREAEWKAKRPSGEGHQQKIIGAGHQQRRSPNPNLRSTPSPIGPKIIWWVWFSLWVYGNCAGGQGSR